jgi:uncharacterized protein
VNASWAALRAGYRAAMALLHASGESAGEQVGAALRALRAGADLAPDVVELHRLENEGDRLSRDAIASLFVAGIDPMVVIRWKDIFESLEAAADACERVAHVLEGIAIQRRR